MRKYKIIMIVIGLILFIQVAYFAFAQQAPTYSFINFDIGYAKLKSEAKNNGYKIDEKEIKSIYGEMIITLSKDMNFYSEMISLFFNEKKELIYFDIKFTLKQNQPRRILEELYKSIRDKLIEKYGENDNLNMPFYKVVNSKYEIFLHPFQSYSNDVEVSFKDVEKYTKYHDYYNQQIKILETQDINKTVNNF